MDEVPVAAFHFRGALQAGGHRGSRRVSLSPVIRRTICPRLANVIQVPAFGCNCAAVAQPGQPSRDVFGR